MSWSETAVMNESLPIGAALADWSPPPPPGPLELQGDVVRLERLRSDHGASLFDAFSVDRQGRLWTYMPHGPFDQEAALLAWIDSVAASADPFFYAIIDAATGRACGVASYLRIQPDAGSIEVGWISYAPELQRTRAATEAMFLMMRWAFEAGYRRYEWKCDALNAASRRAAERLGFTFEGVFRQATVVKGRNRDTAWFAMIDGEWPALRQAYEIWLDPSNFDGQGQQRQSLGTLSRSALEHP